MWSRSSQSVAVASVLGLVCAGAWPTVGQAGVNSYVPNAGGVWSACGNWSLGRCPNSTDDVEIIVSGSTHKTVDYDWTGSTSCDSVTIDGSGSFYGMLLQLDNGLLTDYMTVGRDGEGWHWMEGDAFVWVLQDLTVGANATGVGYVHLNAPGNGILVNDETTVGLWGTGEFDHRNGYHACDHLWLGFRSGGTYWLSGPEDTSTLTVTEYAAIGHWEDGVGVFDQTGGTFYHENGYLAVGDSAGSNGTYYMKGGVLNAADILVGYAGVGLMEQTGGTVNTGEILLGYYFSSAQWHVEGAYNMRGGTLNAEALSIAWDSDGSVTQSGGLVDVTGNVVIGLDQPDYPEIHASPGWYKVNENDGPSELSIGGDLRIGAETLGKYEQESGGVVTVGGNIEIWRGTTDPVLTSYLYMGLTANSLTAGSVVNHSGYYDQDGGFLSTTNFTNDSPQGINLDNSADCRARYLTSNAGTVHLWRNARLRGPAAGGGFYWACNFTNNATFQMGATLAPGGTFEGILTNYGTFNYYQGDFSRSTLINHGTFNNNAPFECFRLVNHATITATATNAITADGTAYVNTIENNGALDVSGAAITVLSAQPLVNNATLTASNTATIAANVDNHGTIEVGPPTSTRTLTVTGDFEQGASGKLALKINKSLSKPSRDRLVGQQTVTLDGTLEVTSIGLTPVIGDSFTMVEWVSRVGQFDWLDLPMLPADRWWEVAYTATGLTLTVAASPIVSTDPSDDSTLCKTQRNVITFTFNGPITLGGSPPIAVQPMGGGADVGGSFEYSLSRDGLTLTAIELGDVLIKDPPTWYRITAAPGFAYGPFRLDLCMLVGDANNSGRVTTADYSDVKAHLGERDTDARYDLNGSRRVTTADYSVVKANLGHRKPTKP